MVKRWKNKKDDILHTFARWILQSRKIHNDTHTHSRNDYTQDKFMERVSIAAYT